MNISDTVIKYWPLILSLFGLGATWIRMQVIDKDHEKRITSLEADQKSVNPTLLQIQIDLAEIKTTLKIHFKESI